MVDAHPVSVAPAEVARLMRWASLASMAVAEMTRIAQELAAETPELRLAVLHRTGSLVVGDVAVVCAAVVIVRRTRKNLRRAPAELAGT